MKRIMIGLIIISVPLVLVGAEHEHAYGDITPPPFHDVVKVHPLDSKGNGVAYQQPLASSSSSSNFFFGALGAVASFFSTVSDQDVEKEKIAREMRDAVLGRNPLILKSLLEKHGSECAERLGPDNYNAFHMACFNQFLEGIDVFSSEKIDKKSERRKVNIDFPDGKGKTPLQVALGCGHVDVARKLVQLGASVDYDELQIVRKFRQKSGSDEGIVKQMTELLANRKKEEAEKYVYDTDSEVADDADDEAEEK